MTKVLHLFIAFLFINSSLNAQTKQELISKDLLNAISALNNKDYVTSVNYLDKCQVILGDEVIPRIEELYISNLKVLENPILLDEHLEKYLNNASKNRQGYQNYLKELISNKQKLKFLLTQLKEESKRTQHSYSTYFSLGEPPANEIVQSTFITNPGELEGNGKIKVFSDDVKLVTLKGIHPANKYYYDTINDLAFSKIGYVSHSFSNGLALVDKVFINKKGENVLNFEEYDQVSYFIKGIALLKKNDKWGAINKEGKIIIPVEYKSVFSILNLEILKVEKDNKYGFYNFKGIQITPLQYEKEMDNTNRGFSASVWFTNENFEANIYPVRLNEKYGYINNKGELIIDYQFKNKSTFKNGLAGLKKNNKWGVIDTLNTTIIPFKYSDLLIQKNIIGAVDSDKKDIMISFFKPNGDLVLPPEYSLISYQKFDKKMYKDGNKLHNVKSRSLKYSIGFIKDSILLEKKNKYYYFNINTLGIKQADFEKVSVLESKILKVEVKNKYGIYDFLGSPILSIEFDELELVGSGNTLDNQIYFKFKKGMTSGIINLHTKETTVLSFKIKEVLQNNLFVAENKDKLGIINLEDQIILPFEYSKIESVDIDIFKVEKNNLKGIINAKGEIILPIEISEIKRVKKYGKYKDVKNYFIEKNDKVGLADSFFNLMAPIIYDKLDFDIQRNAFYFERGNKVGYIDKAGKEFLKSQYKILEVVTDNCIIAKNKLNKIGVVNSNEIIKVPFDYNLINVIDENTFSVIKDNKFGVVNLNNKVVVPLIYDFLNVLYNNKGMLIVKREDKIGVISLLNKEIIPLKYDAIEPQGISGVFKVKLNGAWESIKI